MASKLGASSHGHYIPGCMHHYPWLVWFSVYLLRASFIPWLAIKNRLTTMKASLLHWNLITKDSSIFFVRIHQKNGNHHFFECHVSKVIWRGFILLASRSKMERKMALSNNAETYSATSIAFGRKEMHGSFSRRQL